MIKVLANSNLRDLIRDSNDLGLKKSDIIQVFMDNISNVYYLVYWE